MAERNRKSPPENGVETAPNSAPVADGKLSYRALTAPRSANARSRVTNGTDFLAGIDGRSAVARRYRDIFGALISDAGGIDRMSEVRKSLCRTYASTALMLEQLDAKLVNGGAVDVSEYAQLSSTLVRLAARIGLGRHAKTVPDLQTYLRTRQQEQDDNADDDAEVIEHDAEPAS